jgi:hypothetical protein
MSNWREAAFIIGYSDEGYMAYTIDDCLLARGSLAHITNGVPLGTWITDIFIGCKNGHVELHYDKNERRLYWTKQKMSESETWSDLDIWVDFSPRHLIHVDVTPPNWRWSNAHEITPKKISLSRLTYDPIDLFGLEQPFTLAALKKRRAMLLKAYHSDNSYHLESTLRAQLDARIIEINDAYAKLVSLAVSTKSTSDTSPPQRKNRSGLGEPQTQPVSDFTKKRKRKRVKVQKRH